MVCKEKESTGESTGELEPLKLLVCGGRKYDDKGFLFWALDKLNPDIIVHGGAPGADTLAGEWCQERRKEERVYYAKWSLYGKKAGPLRNRFMLKEELEGLLGVIAFPGGRGTEDMIATARLFLPPNTVFKVHRK